MKTIGVIPARYASTRFPGKPLADIHGKPMVWYPYQAAKSCALIDEVYVATDSEIVASSCRAFGANVLMTSENCQTFTDRVIEVSQKVFADLYIVVLGDEPMLVADDIDLLVESYQSNKSAYAIFLAEKILFAPDAINTTVIKSLSST